MTSTPDVARKPGGAEPSRRSAAPPERPSDHGHQPTIELPLMTASEAIASVAAPFVQPRIGSVEDALRLQTVAAVKRAGAPVIENEGDIAGAMVERAEAEDMETAALAYLGKIRGTATPGNGGELLDLTPNDLCDYPRLVDTLKQSPDALSAGASRARLELASQAGALTLGVDVAETIKARNSMERMLAHQLGALHTIAMQMVGRAGELLRDHKHTMNQATSIEAARNANTAAKLMTAFQTGCIAMERMRRGGKQTVRVIYQQVAVAEGGQAIVAGSIKRGGSRQKRSARRTGGGHRNAV